MQDDIIKTIDKFERLKIKIFSGEYIKESEDEIKEIDKKLRVARVKLELLQIDGVRMLLDRYFKENRKISLALAYRENLTDEERKIMFAKRDWNNEFIRLFTEAKATLTNIEKDIEYQLEDKV